MVDAKPYLKGFIDESDYENLGSAIVKAYKACDSFMESNKVFSNFIIGMEHRSRLINVFVDHALTSVDGFTFEIKPNAANNCHHVRIYKNRLAITAHFLGRGEFPRKIANTAINRDILCARNSSLFPDEEMAPDISIARMGYSWILHSGFINPKNLFIAIPAINQKRIFASTPLPIPEVKQSDIEQVKEEMIIKLLSHQDTGKENAS